MAIDLRNGVFLNRRSCVRFAPGAIFVRPCNSTSYMAFIFWEESDEKPSLLCSVAMVSGKQITDGSVASRGIRFL